MCMSFHVYDVIVPVATRSNASSFTRKYASDFKTEYSYKIILLQFLLMRVKANECTFATPLNYQNDAPVGNYCIIAKTFYSKSY